MSAETYRLKKRFGQHFLHDRSIIGRIVDAVAPDNNDHLVEIGPGKGALTGPILKRVNHLHVIEIDRDLAGMLTRNLGQPDNLSIHNTDALRFDFKSMHHSDLRIIGNLPYNISTPLLFHLISFVTCVKDMHFMLQKEVVERICAVPGTKQYGRLSVMVQLRCAVQNLFTIGPGAFNPSPRVNSALLRLVPFAEPKYQLGDHACFGSVVKDAFSQRRKTIRNSLKNQLTNADFEQLQIAPTMRAENLTLEDFVNLANYVSATKIKT